MKTPNQFNLSLEKGAIKRLSNGKIILGKKPQNYIDSSGGWGASPPTCEVEEGRRQAF